MKNDKMMSTETGSYVNFRWADNGRKKSASNSILFQSAAIKATPVIVRKLVGANDGVIKDFLVNRAQYKRQYLRFVHLCCEDSPKNQSGDSDKKDNVTSAKFLLDLISKGLQRVLYQRLKDRESQSGNNENEEVKLLYEVSIRVYDCTNFEYPNKEEWDLYDGVLWSGSTFAAERNEDLWVIRLKEEIRRKITIHKRKTLVISLKQSQQQQEQMRNSCSRLIDTTVSTSGTKDEEEKRMKNQEQKLNEEGPYMVTIQADQEYSTWCKATSYTPVHEKGKDMITEQDINNFYNSIECIAEAGEKFGWFPSPDIYRVLIKKTISSSSYTSLGSIGSIPSIGSSLQFHSHLSRTVPTSSRNTFVKHSFMKK